MDLSLLNTTTNTAGTGASSRLSTALVPKAATANVTAKASSGTSGSSSSTAADNSTITANDFLTLLVSELKNQDPTQPADPTQYISQLVGVNSLQQLIQINQSVGSLEDTILG